MKALRVAAAVAAVLLSSACDGEEGAQAQAQAQAAVHLEPLSIQTASGAVRRFQVEIADDDAERERGLMFRESLANDRGMLFQFPDADERSFWMRNTYIPLDIIYVGADGKIVSIARNTTPFSERPVPSYGPAKGVLEIPGGQAEKQGIAVGDVIRHPFFGTAG